MSLARVPRAARWFLFAVLDIAHEDPGLPQTSTQADPADRCSPAVVYEPGEPRWLCGFVVHPGSREEALGSSRPDGCGYRGALSPSVGQATVPAYPVTLPSSQVSAPRS